MENREIKFRGRCVITGNWAYGYYYKSKGHHIIRDGNDFECIVLEKSVTEYTSLKDKNGKEIYEEDIVRHFSHGSNASHVIIFQLGTFRLKQILRNGNCLMLESQYKFIEVIGNIYENPELLK